MKPETHVSDETFFRLIIDQNRHGFEAQRLQKDAATWFQEMDLARCRFIVSFQHVFGDKLNFSLRT